MTTLPRRRALPFVLGLAALLGGRSAAALPLISEVLYDAVGTDDGALFVELYGTPGASVEGWTLEGINGSDGSVTHTLTLSGVFPEDGLLVIADEASDGGTLVAGADLLASFDFQNGPDSLVLRDALGAAVDAVGYGTFATGEVFAGEGAPAPDPAAGASIARRFADVDTGDNAADFLALDVPTPGTAPLSPVPEPAAALLLGSGLAVLAASRRR